MLTKLNQINTYMPESNKVTFSQFAHGDYPSIRTVLENNKIEFIEFGYSNYGGSLIARANIKWCLGNLKKGRDYIHMFTDFSGEMMLLIRNGYTAEIMDTLSGYPLIEEDTYSTLENELLEEAITQVIEDHTLRSTCRVRAALSEALSYLGSVQANYYDYAEDEIMTEFKRLYCAA